MFGLLSALDFNMTVSHIDFCGQDILQISVNKIPEARTIQVLDSNVALNFGLQDKSCDDTFTILTFCHFFKNINYLLVILVFVFVGK